MVSQIEYPHIANQVHLSRKPFGTVVKVVVVAIFAILDLILTGAAVAIIYVLSGPIKVAWTRMRQRSGG
jgi:hypothetical protein